MHYHKKKASTKCLSKISTIHFIFIIAGLQLHYINKILGMVFAVATLSLSDRRKNASEKKQ